MLPSRCQGLSAMNWQELIDPTVVALPQVWEFVRALKGSRSQRASSTPSMAKRFLQLLPVDSLPYHFAKLRCVDPCLARLLCDSDWHSAQQCLGPGAYLLQLLARALLLSEQWSRLHKIPNSILGGPTEKDLPHLPGLTFRHEAKHIRRWNKWPRNVGTFGFRGLPANEVGRCGRHINVHCETGPLEGSSAATWPNEAAKLQPSGSHDDFPHPHAL